jgi:hypothetical protein
VSEERPQHPQEPAEGGGDEVEAPGADKSSEGVDTPDRPGAGRDNPSDHPDEPAEGDEEDVGASGADRPG